MTSQQVTEQGLALVRVAELAGMALHDFQRGGQAGQWRPQFARGVRDEASLGPNANTITFTQAAVSFTVVAIAPGGPDMTFRVAGLTNPAIVVPTGAHVTVRFINNDTDEAHGWLITADQPPFGFGQPANGGRPGRRWGEGLRPGRSRGSSAREAAPDWPGPPAAAPFG